MLATRARMAAAGRGGGLAAPTFVDGASGYSASSTTVNVAKPSGVQSGDLLLAVLACATNRTFTTPAGWTLLTDDSDGDDLTVRTYYRVVDGSEGASFTYSTNSPTSFLALCVAYRGVDTVSPIDASGANTGVVNTTVSCPSITTTGPNRRIVAAGVARPYNNLSAAPGGTTEVESNVGNNVSARVVEFEQAAAGNTGTTSFTVSSSSYLHGVTIALTPGS